MVLTTAQKINNNGIMTILRRTCQREEEVGRRCPLAVVRGRKRACLPGLHCGIPAEWEEVK
jgi:hypothetical protein